MDRSNPECSASGDRLSKLDDRVLGNILSYLPSKEAARGSLLSSRWRHAFAAVHTISLEEPEGPVPDEDAHHRGCDSPECQTPPDPNAPPPFSSAVSASIIARLRRRGAALLRALRVAMETFRGGDSSTVDQWVSYAVQQAAPEGLHLDLRLLCHHRPCQHPYKLRRGKRPAGPDTTVENSPKRRKRSMGDSGSESDDDSNGVSSDYDEPKRFIRPRVFSPSPRRPCSRSDSAGSESDDDSNGVSSDYNEPRRFRRRAGSPSPPRSCSPGVAGSESDDDSNGVSSGYDEPKPLVRRFRIPSPRRPCSPGDAVYEFDDDDGGSVVSSDDDERLHHVVPWWERPPPEYTVPRALFSCAELRSLTLSGCRVAPPAAAVRLPSLVTLVLSDVPDAGADVQLLLAGCPRLAELELEACGAVTSLTVLGGARLRRLALRCCHKLAAVAVDSSELQAFEYRGAVPDPASFLTLHGGAGRVVYCKLDICGAEATSEAELTNLRQFLQLFANAKHLHLESARLGSGFDKDVPTRLAAFSNLRRLEMRGCLPDDDAGGALAAVSRILEHAPNLEALSLAFHPDGEHCWGDRHPDYGVFSQEELVDAHHLNYNPHSVLAAPSAMIPCLRSTVREINLVHYHGGMAQRALAKFLLCNAPVVDKLWCEFAEGPMWTQVQLMRELKGWLINKSADTHFA